MLSYINIYIYAAVVEIHKPVANDFSLSSLIFVSCNLRIFFKCNQVDLYF